MNLKKYNQIFIQLFDLESDQLNSELKFNESPNWDSLSHMELISELEDEFEILLDAEDILHFGSYENGIKILKKYGVEL